MGNDLFYAPAFPVDNWTAAHQTLGRYCDLMNIREVQGLQSDMDYAKGLLR